MLEDSSVSVRTSSSTAFGVSVSAELFASAVFSSALTVDSVSAFATGGSLSTTGCSSFILFNKSACSEDFPATSSYQSGFSITSNSEKCSPSQVLFSKMVCPSCPNVILYSSSPISIL